MIKCIRKEVEEKSSRTLKSRIYKSVTLVLKNIYIDKLLEAVKEYNSSIYATFKINPTNV